MQLAAALDETGHALLVCDGEGQVLYQTPGAARLMAPLSVAGGDVGSGLLPASLRVWFAAQVVAARVASRVVFLGSPHQVMRCRLRMVGTEMGADRYRLTVERIVTPREQVVWLARRLHLTRRQAQVLQWATQGKTNPEIAVILGVQRSTVRKHLENVFARLGVENRLAAAALVGRLRPPS